jgi:DNA-binding protein YbaB
LQDLVVGAIADAAQQVTIMAHDRLGPLAGGMGGLGLPGM